MRYVPDSPLLEGGFLENGEGEEKLRIARARTAHYRLHKTLRGSVAMLSTSTDIHNHLLLQPLSVYFGNAVKRFRTVKNTMDTEVTISSGGSFCRAPD